MQDTLDAKTGSTEFKGVIPKSMSRTETIVLQSNFHKLRALQHQAKLKSIKEEKERIERALAD